MLLKVKSINPAPHSNDWFQIDPINHDKTVQFLHKNHFLSDFMIIGDKIYANNNGIIYLKETK